MASTPNRSPGSYISFHSQSGQETKASPVNVSRHRVVFEIFGSGPVLQLSEVLADLQIQLNDRLFYSGRAVISNLIQTNTSLLCEVRLEDGWRDSEVGELARTRENPERGFSQFLGQWQKDYRINSAFKGAVTDIQSFLHDLRQWTEELELSIRGEPAGDRSRIELETSARLSTQSSPVLDRLFENFELALAGVPEEQVASYAALSRRQLHPLLLSSPFLYRTFHKPLGYAGDYEMVNMMIRNPNEGASLFAKVVNAWFIQQPPAEAHRNRLSYLVRHLDEAAAKAIAAGRKARIISIGCGPAQELQRFIAEREHSDHVECTLVDFNEETLTHTAGLLGDIKRAHGRRTVVKTIKKSVLQILKESGRAVQKPGEAHYDLAYCAGLFDYLPDNVCKRITDVMFGSVAPGGVFISTNVEASNPRRLTMDLVMDWHLIYRNAEQLAATAPTKAGLEWCEVLSDPTGVNIYLEARKP